MSPFTKKVTYICVFLMTNAIAFGQELSGPPPPAPKTVPVGLPIDENIVFLLLGGLSLGVVYALRKLRASKLS